MEEVSALPVATVARDLSRTPNRDLTLRHLADAYMAGYVGRDPGRTHHLIEWCKLIGERRVSELDADLVADTLDHFARTPARRYLGRDKATGAPRWKVLGDRTPATLNRYKCSLSAVFTWAKRKRLLPRGWANPCREIAAEPENNTHVRFLSPLERERLLKVCRVSAWPKLTLLVLMALTTGARRSELLGLRYGDLDLDAGTAHLATSKNGKPRVLPLTAAIITEIRRHGMPHADALVFAGKYRTTQPASIDTVWQTALRDARIENFRFHDLRHSCASYLAQSGASLLEIADVLGHQSIDVTKRYSHLTVDTKRELVTRVLGGIA